MAGLLLMDYDCFITGDTTRIAVSCTLPSPPPGGLAFRRRRTAGSFRAVLPSQGQQN